MVVLNIQAHAIYNRQRLSSQEFRSACLLIIKPIPNLLIEKLWRKSSLQTLQQLCQENLKIKNMAQLVY